ncbi:hypothetical protein [Ideonella oryzae]|uniref:Uncharacterized protein n=1 Tax=Ideonella oryzae TaxID=2937441 RepID=A0ABT1BLT2_9BURK|nr:hypothetical protein [Ideonella oryzae]MCO5976332.1 hypothetical protein [Ideonella oryzae]
MSALPKPYDRLTFLALCRAFDRRVVDGELVLPPEGTRYLDMAGIAEVNCHADTSSIAGLASQACYWLDGKGIWYRPRQSWEGDMPLHALSMIHRAPGVIEPLLPFQFDAFDLAMYCASGPGWMLMDYIACHLQGDGVDVGEGVAQAVEALPPGRLRDEVATLIAETWRAWQAGMRSEGQKAARSLSAPNAAEREAGGIDGDFVGPVDGVEAQSLVKTLAELQQRGDRSTSPSAVSSDVWGACASPVESWTAPDLSLAATRSQLISVFGGMSGMNRSWFANLKDKPALDKACVLRGQPGRHHTEPMFDPYAVLLWLMDRRRKIGRRAPVAALWAAFRKHFPDSFERYKDEAPINVAGSTGVESSGQRWEGIDSLIQGITNPGAGVAAGRATGQTGRSRTPSSQSHHVE